MSVECVIFDVSDTMLRQGQAVPGIVEAVQRLRRLGIQIVAVHNDGPKQVIAGNLVAAGIAVEHVVTRYEVGIAKGSPLWIEYIKHLTGLRTNQLVYVGDSNSDMITASHAKVVYFHAAWAKPEAKYGLLAQSPGWVAAVVEHIFRKQHTWGWTFTYHNLGGSPVRQMAIADVNVLKQAGIQYDLVEMLKDRADPHVGMMPLREFVVLHLTASIYFDGLQDTTDIWSIMPSHDGQRTSRMMQSIDVVAKLFRDRYNGDLLVRHKPALHSREARNRNGISRAIANQVDTLIVNPATALKIANKTALLIDDFATMGVTSSVARVLLKMGGATDVVTVAIGKYTRQTMILGRPIDGQNWDVTRPAPANAAALLRRRDEQGMFNDLAQQEFLESYQAMMKERW